MNLGLFLLLCIFSFFIIVGVVYIVLSLILHLLFRRRTAKHFLLNFNSLQSGLTLIASFIIVFSFVYIKLTEPGGKNYKTAYIDKDSTGYRITVRGKRVLMSHSLTFSFKDDTYETEDVIHVPVDKGIIDVSKFPHRSGHYRQLGTIEINKDRLRIKMYYDNTDDKKIDPSTWNGSYYLMRRY